MNEIPAAVHNIGIPVSVVAHGAAHFGGAPVPASVLVHRVTAACPIGAITYIAVVVAVGIAVVTPGVAVEGRVVAVPRGIVRPMVLRVAIVMGARVAITARPSENQAERRSRHERTAIVATVASAMLLPMGLTMMATGLMTTIPIMGVSTIASMGSG
ncbi:MAG: hypothetical protein CML99_00990 [Rhodobiaceae bacterium]|nr:hypothetical protein [Rhodobiaceae bacterium]